MRHRKTRKPGQIIDVNEQCRQMVGEKSSFCNVSQSESNEEVGRKSAMLILNWPEFVRSDWSF
jgi:hypothetical protein